MVEQTKAWGRIVSLRVLLTFAAASCSVAPPEDRTLPNVILITFDTLRADHLDCYGYGRAVSPHIDEFARTATLYSRAMASSPWTVPTHSSLFTGKNPFEHGAHTFKVDTWMNNVSPLASSHLTLAEAFQQESYTTAAFVANAGFLGPRWQMNQGFETYHVERVESPMLNRRIFDWLESLEERPFFLFINYIDTHRPYNTTPRPGLLKEPAVRDRAALLDALIDAVMGGDGTIPPALAQKVIDQYDTAIANVDEQFGELTALLKKLGLYENSTIVITSDHGEFFGEHQLVEHSKDVYQEGIWVPLIVKSAGQKQGKIVETLTSSTDVPGLIFSDFSSDIRARYLKDFGDVPGNHPVVSENYYSRLNDLFNPTWGDRFNRVRTAIYEWPHKFIHSSDGHHELYDLMGDPGEKKNLLTELPEVAQRLSRALEQFRAERDRGSGVIVERPLTEEEIDELRSLGYVDD